MRGLVGKVRYAMEVLSSTVQQQRRSAAPTTN